MNAADQKPLEKESSAKVDGARDLRARCDRSSRKLLVRVVVKRHCF